MIKLILFLVVVSSNDVSHGFNRSDVSHSVTIETFESMEQCEAFKDEILYTTRIHKDRFKRVRNLETYTKARCVRLINE